MLTKSNQLKGFIFVVLLALLVFPNAKALYDDSYDFTLVKNAETFQDLIVDSDFLSVILFCSETVENCRLLEPAFNEFAKSMKDFVKIYVINCENVDKTHEGSGGFPLCNSENIQHLPYLVAYEPPATKINPYTRQPSKPTERAYQGNGDPKSIATFARQHMPAFREIISTKGGLEAFLSDQYIPNKVILFTNKPQTSPLYKSLASEYRDRLLFAEINESSKDLIQEYKITKYPTLIIVKRKDDGSYEKEVYEKDLNIDQLRSFLNGFALSEKANRPETPRTQDTSSQETHSEKPQPKDTQIKVGHLTPENFETEVNKHERVVLIHLFNEETHPLLPQVTEKYTRFFEYFDLDCTKEENIEFAREKLGVKSFPSLVALPIGKEKRLSARTTFSKAKPLQELSQEISELVGDKVMSISAMEMQGVISNSLVKKRPVFIMLYDTNEASLTYRMLSQLSRYEDKITFTKFKNPPPEALKQFQTDKLPSLLVVLLQDSSEDDIDIDPNKVQLAKYSGKLNYEDLSRYFDMFLPEEEILQELHINKKVQEVTNKADLDKYCPADSRVCVIGLLNGYTGTPEASSKLEENLAILNLALKKHPHLPFMWIDAICHSEILLSLDIQSEYIPTVIVYNPVLKEYVQLVGMFDNASIAVFLEKVLKKRLTTYPLRDGIVLEQKNCSEVHENLQKQESSSYGSEDDEILREILEERRKREEAEQAEKKKKKKKRRIDDEL